MSPLIPLAIGGAALGALAFSQKHDNTRELWLVQGKRYNIVIRVTGAGFDASMLPGFGNFSQPILTASGPGWGEVQLQADWMGQKTLWLVPDNVAIAEA